MMLVITPSAKARGCAQSIQHVTSEETHVAATLSQALAQLRAQEYVAVLIDQAFLECEPVESDMVLEHIGTAIPVHVNFAIHSMDRVMREFARRIAAAQEGSVAGAARSPTSSSHTSSRARVTALLLSCEMALQVPDLPGAAAVKMRDAQELAQQVRVRLEVS